MKTKEQVLRYVSQCEFQDDDWQKVLEYCRINFGGGKAHRALKPLPNSMSTYGRFLEWIDSGIGVGDIVVYCKTIGIVGACTPGYAMLSAYLSLDGDLIDNVMEVPIDKICPADEHCIALMKRKLIENACEFSISLSRCVKSYQPNGGDIVRITLNNDEQTVGVFRACDNDVKYFYVYVDGDSVVKDKECLIGDVTLSLPTKRDIQKLMRVLSKNKLEWSPRLRCLQPAEVARSAKNNRYWYIGDRFSVCSDIDKYTKLHEERYQNGNYFTSYSLAILFAQKIKELRKEMAGEV